MDQGYRMLGFVVIVILYAVIGLMAAAGAIFIARKILAPKGRAAVVVAFVAIALPGARLPFALIVGYSLPGLWDLRHELQNLPPRVQSRGVTSPTTRN
jgi:hypothetical protein